MKAKSPLVQKIEQAITPAIEDMGFEIVEISISNSNRPIVQILVDTTDIDTHITLDECGEVSQAISAILDVEDIMGEKPYMLDVGSPGVDRPLTKEADFKKFEGRNAKIHTDTLIDGVKRFKGKLNGVEEDKVILGIEGTEETVKIPFNYIEKAKLFTSDDELLNRSGKNKF